MKPNQSTIDDLYFKTISDKIMLNQIIYRLDLMKDSPDKSIYEKAQLTNDIAWIKEKVDNKNRLIKIIEENLL